MDRCKNQKNPSFKDYGGRGIDVCERWKLFDNFFADMGEKPASMTIERIDNNAGYEPANCKWADKTEQANNRRSSRNIEWSGSQYTLAELAKKYGIKIGTLWHRLKCGWPIEQAVSVEPLVGRNQFS